jgi:hypothetical protein
MFQIGLQFFTHFTFAQLKTADFVAARRQTAALF